MNRLNTEKSANHFVERSIIQNIHEFKTPGGTMRFVRNGAAIHAYRLDGDAFVHQGVMPAPLRTPSNRKLYAMYRDRIAN